MLYYKITIGILGGIASGKSYVSKKFKNYSCHVVHADDFVNKAYELDAVKQKIYEWWGNDVINPDRSVNKKFIAQKVFSPNSSVERLKLEELIFPIIHEAWHNEMEKATNARAFVLDIPLLMETNMHKNCDYLIFVDTPDDIRLERCIKRGWKKEDLINRENCQIPLSFKKDSANYVISHEDVDKKVAKIWHHIKSLNKITEICPYCGTDTVIMKTGKLTFPSTSEIHLQGDIILLERMYEMQ